MNFFLKAVMVSLLAGIILLAAAGLIFEFAGETWIATGVGTVFALVYVVAGFFSFYLAFRYRPKMFNRIVITSIAVRMILMVIAIVLVMKFTALDMVAFLVALFVWYFIFQIWEVLSFNKLIAKGI
jgi:hypothetical protein